MSNLSDQFSPLDTTVKGCFLIIKEGSRVKVESLQQKTYSIGRNTSANINLTSKGISRHHATTYYAKGKYWILDGDPEGNLSTNGLTIKGQRKQLHQLSSGDVIAFCDNVFAMFLDKEDIRIGDKKEVCLLADTIGFLGIDDWLGVNTETVIEDRDLGFQQPKTDDLTKLPNRSTFLDRVRQSILFKETVNNNHKFAVLFIDLDRFKLVNDSLGHFAGDLLLIHVSEAMHSCLRSRDMLARLGGDEFAILIDYIHDYDESVQIARRLQENLEKSLWIEEHEIFPSASIGLVFSELAYKQPEEILRNADIAMYQAKSNGRGRLEVFNESMREKSIHLLKIDADLRRALSNQEFKLYYQPIVSLKEKRLTGFEALIRWHHPERGLIPPDEFIKYLEEKSLIYKVGQWVLEEACRQLSLWKTPGCKIPDLAVSINLASKQVLDTNLVHRIQYLLEHYRLAAKDIKIEVTENIVIDDSKSSMMILAKLKQLGVEIYVDDFGTGYSSLSYLHKFPIDALKIDRSFIAEVDTKSDKSVGFSVTQSIIGLAHNLGVKVVAEGIENIHHLFYLKASGCDYGQGYLFSKPLTAKQATNLVEQGFQWTWKY